MASPATFVRPRTRRRAVRRIRILQIGDGYSHHQHGHRAGRRDLPSESHLMGQLGEGLEGGVRLVVRPSLEVLEEQGSSDRSRVGGGSARGSVGPASVGRWSLVHEVGQDSIEASPTVTEEPTIPTVIPSIDPLSGPRLFRMGRLWSLRGRSAASAGVCRHNRRRGVPFSRTNSTGSDGCTETAPPLGTRVSGHTPSSHLDGADSQFWAGGD